MRLGQAKPWVAIRLGAPRRLLILRQGVTGLRAGGSLDPFWLGKIAASHFDIIQELSMRRLLNAPEIKPAFLSHPQAAQRLEKAMLGLSAVEMLSS